MLLFSNWPSRSNTCSSNTCKSRETYRWLLFGTKMALLNPVLRLRTFAPCRILRNICSRRSTYCFGYSHSKNTRSTTCLNNAQLQFCTRITQVQSYPVIPARTLTYYSRRKGKRKTVKSVIRRFRRTGSGKWKRWQAGKNHFNSKKSSQRRSRLRRYVICNKQQTKLLNKMVNGW